ncbi:type 11 methyltransferase [Mycoplasmopsis canis UFG4]|uniref:Type 11 methyltransferase n=2 Tax=Mycoplasmopsis canis TaxID=29555 RepID=I1A5L1_9BACT|nr:class I SAM-dependent methyltransferase [Mycoplasmopsis canis]AMD81150.1 methyltransferase type 11 [Mycoplasmopsis canis PG 14]EIE39785.1 type 11 methyltransferase [Mycoplasmopsis canis PG 14]EIE41571.1 type 11 methyltransferase [Mycoplasmopsis canis UFG1]EIE41782.1 type 11 methyltransferase [Mycoplasmopsis canis UFG4]VEU68973.1 Demethylmenaquinone methyltransferase [Mycoplasmopsis canis]
MVNKNDKSVFHNEKTLLKYGNATINVRLWKSEEFLITKYIPKQSKILDIGCGSGRTTFWLYEKGWNNITGADISSSMIKQCNDINNILNYSINFLVEDATNLNFKNNEFDFVFFSFNGWPGIPSNFGRIKALKEIYRVLKPGGIFIFTAHERDEQKYLQNYKKNIEHCKEFKFEIFGDYIFKNEENACDFMHLYSTNEIKDIIKQNTNFKVIEIVNRDKQFNENQHVLDFSDNTNFWILKK